MRLIILVSVLLYVQLGSLCGQDRDSLHFVLIDDETGQAIEDAFVFIENTTIGTSTDQSGKAALYTSGLSAFNIVITHINYENFYAAKELLANENIIRLEKRALTLELITVKSKKLSKKKRRKWMKRFEKSFLGDKLGRKKVRIVNPEVIWFEEQEQILYAYAVDNIKIKNDLIGYEMQVALDHFSVSSTDDVRYEGRVFYNDVMSTLKKRDKIEETRNTSFLNSRQLFYKALVFRHPILDKQFEYGITSAGENNGLVFEKKSHIDFNWQRTLTEDILYIDSSQYLTVIKKDIITKTYDRKQMHKRALHLRPASSFLKSRTGKFIFNKQGELLNKTDVEESGYWTNFRMAKELPVEYTGSISIEKEQNATITKLVNYEVQYGPEKIYLHTDKNIYFPYERIWFKGYLLNAIDHTPSIRSEVMYIELLDSERSIVNSCTLHKDNGYKGDFLWGANYESGNYLIRAYTNYMRNDSTLTFYEKSVELKNPIDRDSVQINSLASADSLRIYFYPESGDLINGISSSVTVKATNTNGHFINIKGHLVNQSGKVITEYQSMHKGMGLLHFTPKADSLYNLKVMYNNKEYVVELPAAKESGITMQINPTESDYIFVDLAASDTLSLKDSYLVGHVRGAVFAFITQLDKQQFKLAKSTIPTGIVQFTIFDGQDRPQAERLVFNEFGYDEVLLRDDDSTSINLMENYKLSIDSTLMDEALDLSVSIVEIKNNLDDNYDSDIKSYVFLQSDIDTEIPGIQQYLSRLDKSNLFFLDLYMRSSFWRRFKWKDLQEDKDLKLNFHAEKHISISGYTSRVDQEEGVASTIMLNTLGNEILSAQQTTSTEGKFTFLDIPLRDSTDIYLQARLVQKTTSQNEFEVAPKGNRLVDIHLEPFNTEHLTQKKTHFTKRQSSLALEEDDLETLNDEFFLRQRQDTSLWQIGLDEVEISRSRITTYNGTGALKYVNFEEANWIAPETHGVQLINKVAPNMRFTKGAEAKLIQITYNLRGEVIYVPMQVIIDGVGFNPEGSNASRFFAMPADKIQSMTIAGNAILVTTRDIPRSTEEYLKSGILTIRHPGYHNAREFSREQISISPVLSTMHWDPELAVTDTGEVIIPIEIKSPNSKIRMVIQGVSQSGKIVSYIKYFGNK